MRRDTIISNIRHQTGIDKVEVTMVMEAFIYQIKMGIQSDGQVDLRGFGTFKKRIRKAKIARNICKNEPFPIPEKTIVKFYPSPLWKIK